jgi:hypothetical protein
MVIPLYVGGVLVFTIGGRGLETKVVLALCDLWGGEAAAEVAAKKATWAERLIGYANAATLGFQKHNAVETYSQSDPNVVLAYFMPGKGHTIVPKGERVAKGKAFIQGFVLALNAAAAGVLTNMQVSA